MAVALKENALREKVTDEVACEAGLINDGLCYRAGCVRLGGRWRSGRRCGRLRGRHRGIYK